LRAKQLMRMDTSFGNAELVTLLKRVPIDTAVEVLESEGRIDHAVELLGDTERAGELCLKHSDFLLAAETFQKIDSSDKRVAECYLLHCRRIVGNSRTIPAFPRLKANAESESLSEEALKNLSRRELQNLAKEKGVKANSKSVTIIEELLMQEAEIGPVDSAAGLVQGYLNVASSIFEQLKTSESSEDSLLVSLKARVKGTPKAVRDSIIMLRKHRTYALDEYLTLDEPTEVFGGLEGVRAMINYFPALEKLATQLLRLFSKGVVPSSENDPVTSNMASYFSFHLMKSDPLLVEFSGFIVKGYKDSSTSIEPSLLGMVIRRLDIPYRQSPSRKSNLQMKREFMYKSIGVHLLIALATFAKRVVITGEQSLRSAVNASKEDETNVAILSLAHANVVECTRLLRRVRTAGESFAKLKGVAIWEELFRDANYFDGLGVMAISQMTHCLFRRNYNVPAVQDFLMSSITEDIACEMKNKADRLLKTGRDDIANDLAESLRLWDLSSMMDALLPRPKHERHFETILDMVRRASERAGKGRSKGGSYAAAASKPTASIPQYISWIMCYFRGRSSNGKYDSRFFATGLKVLCELLASRCEHESLNPSFASAYASMVELQMTAGVALASVLPDIGGKQRAAAVLPEFLVQRHLHDAHSRANPLGGKQRRKKIQSKLDVLRDVATLKLDLKHFKVAESEIIANLWQLIEHLQRVITPGFSKLLDESTRKGLVCALVSVLLNLPTISSNRHPNIDRLGRSLKVLLSKMEEDALWDMNKNAWDTSVSQYSNSLDAEGLLTTILDRTEKVITITAVNRKMEVVVHGDQSSFFQKSGLTGTRRGLELVDLSTLAQSPASLPGPANVSATTLTAENVASLPPGAQMSRIAEELSPLIQDSLWRRQAHAMMGEKIMRMLLDLDNAYLLHLLASPEALEDSITDSLERIRASDAQMQDYAPDDTGYDEDDGGGEVTFGEAWDAADVEMQMMADAAEKKKEDELHAATTINMFLRRSLREKKARQKASGSKYDNIIKYNCRLSKSMLMLDKGECKLCRFFFAREKIDDHEKLIKARLASERQDAMRTEMFKEYRIAGQITTWLHDGIQSLQVQVRIVNDQRHPLLDLEIINHPTLSGRRLLREFKDIFMPQCPANVEYHDRIFLQSKLTTEQYEQQSYAEEGMMLNNRKVLRFAHRNSVTTRENSHCAEQKHIEAMENFRDYHQTLEFPAFEALAEAMVLQRRLAAAKEEAQEEDHDLADLAEAMLVKKKVDLDRYIENIRSKRLFGNRTAEIMICNRTAELREQIEKLIPHVEELEAKSASNMKSAAKGGASGGGGGDDEDEDDDGDDDDDSESIAFGDFGEADDIDRAEDFESTNLQPQKSWSGAVKSGGGGGGGGDKGKGKGGKGSNSGKSAARGEKGRARDSRGSGRRRRGGAPSAPAASTASTAGSGRSGGGGGGGGGGDQQQGDGWSEGGGRRRRRGGLASHKNKNKTRGSRGGGGSSK
jgi:hypothetical protein